MLDLKTRLKKLASNYQEILFWMPPALFMVFLAFHFIPRIDPRSGIDGFGQLFAMLVNVVGGIMVCFSAWLTKRNYLGIWSDEDMLQLRTFLVARGLTPQEKYALLGAHTLDLVEWVMCFVFWYVVVF